MTAFVVYEIWNPLDNIRFYVGKGSGSRSRFRDHLRQARKLREGKTLDATKKEISEIQTGKTL